MVERNTDAEHIRDRRLLAVYGAFSLAKKRPENANKVLISAVLVGVVVERRWGQASKKVVKPVDCNGKI